MFSCLRLFIALQFPCFCLQSIYIPSVSLHCYCFISCSGSSGGYSYSSSAFIFSLINKEGLAPFKSMVKIPNTQFTRHEVLVQYLVEEMTSSSAIMPTLIFIRTQTLMAGTTQCQVEYITVEQSLLGLIISRLMKWRFFILYESRVIETA